MIRPGVNRCIMIGYLNSDPERRALQSGDFVVNFRLVTAEVWQDQHTGKECSREEHHRVAIFNEGLGRGRQRFFAQG